MSEVKRQFETITSNGVLWINIQKPTFADINALGQKYPFHRLNLEDCLSKIQIPKIDRYESHIFAILHFPTPDKEKGFLFSQLAIFMGSDYLVTIHQGDLKALQELFNMCKSDEKQKQAIMGRSSGYLLHKIIDTLVDDLLHILMKVVGNIDDIEDSVFDEQISIPRQISLLRREITTLRRMVIPLRRTVADLSKDVQRFSREDLAPYFKDVQDHIEKIYEALEEAKETVEIYKDTDYMLSQEKTNKILGVLTIVFTLSIPRSHRKDIRSFGRGKRNSRDLQGHGLYAQPRKNQQNIGCANNSVHAIDPSYRHWHILRYEHQSARRFRNGVLDSTRTLHFFGICFGSFIDFCPTYDTILQKAWMVRIIQVTAALLMDAERLSSNLFFRSQTLFSMSLSCQVSNLSSNNLQLFLHSGVF